MCHPPGQLCLPAFRAAFTSVTIDYLQNGERLQQTFKVEELGPFVCDAVANGCMSMQVNNMDSPVVKSSSGTLHCEPALLADYAPLCSAAQHLPECQRCRCQ